MYIVSGCQLLYILLMELYMLFTAGSMHFCVACASTSNKANNWCLLEGNLKCGLMCIVCSQVGGLELKGGFAGLLTLTASSGDEQGYCSGFLLSVCLVLTLPRTKSHFKSDSAAE